MQRMFLKWGRTPQITHFNRIFHEVDHPFGVPPWIWTPPFFPRRPPIATSMTAASPLKIPPCYSDLKTRAWNNFGRKTMAKTSHKNMNAYFWSIIVILCSIRINRHRYVPHVFLLFFPAHPFSVSTSDQDQRLQPQESGHFGTQKISDFFANNSLFNTNWFAKNMFAWMTLIHFDTNCLLESLTTFEYSWFHAMFVPALPQSRGNHMLSDRKTNRAEGTNGCGPI